MMQPTPQTQPLAGRFWQYQQERFPFVQHGFLITVFTFSAASYSHMCRGETGFIPVSRFLTGALTAIILFFLLRVCDEFKDFEDDCAYRPHRAVPRGLVTLSELAWIAAGAFGFLIVINALLMPIMLIPLAVVMLYLGLMTKEFFVPDWLKKHPLTYMMSHMVIMPLIDGYTTGLDWLNSGGLPPRGVEIFLVVSFFNGIVIEVGRKIRAPQNEAPGVETYSALYGPVGATLLWFSALLVTFLMAWWACSFIGFGQTGFVLLILTLVMCIIPGILFMHRKNNRHAKFIETAAGLWTIGMYLIVGATPMVLSFFNQSGN